MMRTWPTTPPPTKLFLVVAVIICCIPGKVVGGDGDDDGHVSSALSRSSDRFIGSLAPEVDCPGFPHPCRESGSRESKDDEERRKEDRILEAAEAKKQAARAAARAKQRKEERIKAAAAAEARKLKEAKEREEIREMRTGKAETSKLTSGPHSIHAKARAGRRSRLAPLEPGKSSPSKVHGETKPPQHGGVTANAKEALHLKADEAKDKTIVVPAKDLGLHSRGDADDGSMTMIAASMLCIFVGIIAFAALKSYQIRGKKGPPLAETTSVPRHYDV